ncbi:hypothetical protein [Azospirillum ramasamyi]|uniref:hypothetical protein n=1 Tax=Azospirillum ramasamyi TaxID=682998 RepID=UPI0013A6CC7E|nr:hypothetical protein [Azospirillum ramasamyi]
MAYYTVYPFSFAVVGMAALFGRILLTLEMAANVTFLLTTLTACFTVMLIPVLLVARRFPLSCVNARSGSRPQTSPRMCLPLGKSRGTPRHG